MRQRMKKFSACFLAALAVLVSVFSVPAISYAAEQEEEWVPFVLGGDFLYPSTFEQVDPSDSPIPIEYLSTFIGNLAVTTGSSYRFKLLFMPGTDQEVSTPYAPCSLEISENEEMGFPITLYTFTCNVEQFGFEGSLQLLFEVSSSEGIAYAAVINNSSVEFAGQPFSLYLETLKPSGVPSAVHGTPAFANGQFVNESVLEYGTAIMYSWGNMDPPPALNPSPTGLYKIQYGSAEYIVSILPHEPSVDGAQTEWWIYSSGTQLGYYWQGGPQQYDVGNLLSAMVLAIPSQDGATLSFTIYDPYGGHVPPSADVPTFLESAGNFINWLITTFGAILAFMLSNPISFVWIIVSLAVVVVKILQNTAEN